MAVVVGTIWTGIASAQVIARCGKPVGQS